VLRRALGLGLFAVLALTPVASGSAADLVIRPSPVAFGAVAPNSGKTLHVTIANTASGEAKPRVFISSGTSQFRIEEGDPFTCPPLHHGQRCIFHVIYHPSNASQDTGTLRAIDTLRPTNRATVSLTGHRAVIHPPSCTMAMKRHQKMIRQVTKRGKRVLKRTPFALSLTQNQDGRVSASASGKTNSGEVISLQPDDNVASAGNGVQLRLPLKTKSEQRIIAEVKKNLVPQMTLTGTCQNSDGDARQVHAVIRFSDSKPGKAFGFPLIADPTPK
jgi:hypothetical protein